MKEYKKNIVESETNHWISYQNHYTASSFAFARNTAMESAPYIRMHLIFEGDALADKPKAPQVSDNIDKDAEEAKNMQKLEECLATIYYL